MSTDYSSDPKGLSRRIMTPVIVGVATVALSVGVFGTWGATAPISGAAVAQGTVGPENSRRVVQHLEGGVIKSIKVRDGQMVKAGQVLIVLDDTKSRSQFEAQEIALLALQAKEQRLRAEAAMYETRGPMAPLVFSEELVDRAKSNTMISGLIEAENARFVSRRAALDSSVKILQQTIDGYIVDVAGYEREIAAIEEQLKVFAQLNDLYSDLQKKGLESTSKVLDNAQRTASSNQQKVERISRLEKTKETIKTTRLQLDDAWTVKVDEVTSELASVSEDVQSAFRTLSSYRNTLDRTTIVSPVNGTLISLAVNTEGAVVQAGQTLVEIVPADDALTLEVKIDPNDIDVVRPGQDAQVTLLSYPQRNLPKMHAKLIEVSADSLVDSADGSTYYTAKLVLDDDEIKKLGAGVSVVPGMPVQAMIQTSSRTFFDYLLSPMIRYAELAFRE